MRRWEREGSEMPRQKGGEVEGVWKSVRKVRVHAVAIPPRLRLRENVRVKHAYSVDRGERLDERAHISLYPGLPGTRLPGRVMVKKLKTAKI